MCGWKEEKRGTGKDACRFVFDEDSTEFIETSMCHLRTSLL